MRNSCLLPSQWILNCGIYLVQLILWGPGRRDRDRRRLGWFSKRVATPKELDGDQLLWQRIYFPLNLMYFSSASIGCKEVKAKLK